MKASAQKQNQPQRHISHGITRSGAQPVAVIHAVDAIASPRCMIENQTVEPLLDMSADDFELASHIPVETRFAHDFSRIPVYSNGPVTLQAKLKVNTPGDICEQEADRIAEQVTHTLEPQLQHADSLGGAALRGRGDRDVKTNVQMNDPGKVEAPHIVNEVLRSSGQPLDLSTRTFMESRLGHDFSRVRLHTDERAAESASAVNALAYTVGDCVVFGADRYAPATANGRRLLAHELVHTVQQEPASKLQRQTDDEFGSVTVTKGQTLYSIARGHGTTVVELQKLNNLTTTNITEGQILKLPAKTSTATTGQQVSADSVSSQGVTEQATGGTKEAPAQPKRLLVAWSIDDGPRGETTEKMKKEGMGGIPQATWFIQYHNIRKADWDNLRKIQASGGEIAIHSFYKDDDHTPWFPQVKGSAYGDIHPNDDMPTRMTMLKAFKQKLNDEKIYPKFVRLPGGLVSELENYAVQLGLAKDAKAIASGVIQGADVSSYGVGAKQIATDFALMKKTLNELNLLLWGSGDLSVNTNPLAIGRQEWTAETSGVGARDDSTTDIVDPYSKTKSKAKLPGGRGSFERVISSMQPGDVRGMVILTHDTATQKGGGTGPDDVRAVREDREQMAKVCAEKNIVLEYHTMSSLFNEVTGKDISTFKADY